MEWGERTFQGAEIVGMGSAKAGGLKTVRGPVWLMLRDWTRKTVGDGVRVGTAQVGLKNHYKDLRGKWDAYAGL